MSRWERYGTRDNAYSRWHRHALDASVAMIDIDGLEYCRRCRAPLALIEVAQDVGQAVKPATVLRVVAELLDGTNGYEVHAYVLLYTADENARRREDWANVIQSFRAKRLHPKPETAFKSMTPVEVKQLLTNLHGRHEALWHGTPIDGDAA